MASKSDKAALMKAKLRDLQFSGNVGQNRIMELLKRLGLSSNECAALLQFYGASQGQDINLDDFIDFLFSGSGGMEPGARKEAAAAAASSGHIVSSWNIRSPELAGNLFEMYPADNTIADPEQAELIKELTLKANSLMLSFDAATPSEYLKNMLPDDLPIKVLNNPTGEYAEYAGPLEKAPLKEADHQEGLEKFFTPRLAGKSPEEVKEYVKRFMEDPAVRWDYWKEQRVHEFIAEDGSGGKSKVNNVIAAATSPILDDVAWNLALGVADMKYHFCSTRVPRTRWLYPEGAVGEELSSLKNGGPKPGEFDLFKLMVWDMLVNKLRDSARKDWKKGEAHWDQTFAALKSSLSHTPSGQEHLQKIVKLLIERPSDIFVLCEASEDIISGNPPPILQEIERAGGFKCKLVTSSELDKTSNVAVLVKEGSFTSCEVQELLDSEGKQLGRAIGVLLTTKAGEKLQCIALHLPSNGYNIPTVCGEIESRLAKGIPTIIAGDLNLDLRNEKAKGKFIKDRPLLKKVVEASEHLWNQPKDKGSVNKRRTAFQAQVSKINLEDFALKDAILTSQPSLGKIEGLIGIADILPSVECPSDHVLMTWHGATWPTTCVS